MIRRPEPDPVQEGEESVWAYPRPPACESVRDSLRIVIDGILFASTRAGYRVLETSHPPVYYFPATDVSMEMLRQNGRQTHCEWKGKTVYYDLVLPNRTVRDVAWSYPEPSGRFAAIKNHLAFYAKVGHCFVGEEEVAPQPGSFYGGWITKNVKGPFKGAPGSLAW